MLIHGICFHVKVRSESLKPKGIRKGTRQFCGKTCRYACLLISTQVHSDLDIILKIMNFGPNSIAYTI